MLILCLGAGHSFLELQPEDAAYFSKLGPEEKGSALKNSLVGGDFQLN